MIARTLEDATAWGMLRDRLLWTPAHKSFRAIGSVRTSNGEMLTPAVWRANRLVDGWAKHAAANVCPLPPDALQAAKRHEQAALFGAAWLGAVTHAANY